MKRDPYLPKPLFFYLFHLISLACHYYYYSYGFILDIERDMVSIGQGTLK